MKFGSSYLNDLYQSLPSDCKFTSNESSLAGLFKIKTDKIITSKYVTINYYLNNNTVEDIGLSVLDSLEKSLLDSEILSRFVERKILELLLIKNDNTLIENLNENKIDLIINQYPILSCDMLQSAYTIMINNKDFKCVRDSLEYELSWINSENEELKYSFPATNTLIRAKDKKELDDEINAKLENFNYTWTEKEKSIPSNISLNELQLNGNIYSTNEKIFYIKEINNNRYFKLDTMEISYIYDPNYLSESLCNLVQNPMLNSDLKIQLKHRKYGYEDVYYTLRLSNLVGFFKNNSTLYTGIEQQNEDGIKAVVIIQNNFLNFIHMLVLDINKNDLFGASKILSASFHTNIPTDNIQNLFEDYEPQKKQFKVKIN